MEAARTPLVTIALTAPSQTRNMTSRMPASGGSVNFAAMVAAVIWPTSPHSEKKTAEKETSAALGADTSFCDARRASLRQTAMATPMKLVMVTVATSQG